MIAQVAEETILQEAQRLVWGDRNKDYGHPLDDYTKTAAYFSTILRHRLKPGESITPEEAVLCMIAVKLSRYQNAPKRDTMTDIAGYAACLYRMGRRREGLE